MKPYSFIFLCLIPLFSVADILSLSSDQDNAGQDYKTDKERIVAWSPSFSPDEERLLVNGTDKITTNANNRQKIEANNNFVTQAATDSDNDGVSDDADECIGHTSGAVNARGCSAEQLDRSQFANTSQIVKTHADESLHYFDDAHLGWGLTQQFERHPTADVTIDNATGLWWEDSSVVTNSYLNWNDANAYCENLDLAGVTAWRLPSEKELQSLLDFSQSDSLISQVFEHRVYSYPPFQRYWAGDRHRIRLSSGSYGYVADYVDFLDGRIVANNDTGRSSGRGVARCVSGEPLTNASITVSSAGYIDSSSNLEWSKVQPLNNDQPMLWNDAIKQCENLVHNGLDDWRLPNIKELLSVIKHHDNMGSGDYSYLYDWRFWSSTVKDGKAFYSGWNSYDHFYTGSSTPGTSNNNPGGATNYVRCVRDNSAIHFDLDAPASIIHNDTLVVDASSAYTDTGEALTYLWRAYPGGYELGADAILQTRALPIGNHEIVLTIRTAGGVSSQYPFDIDVLVDATNLAPTAYPASFKIGSVDGQPGAQGTLSGTDPEGVPLSFEVVDHPSRGSVAIDRDGLLTYYRNGPQLPAPINFTFRAFDGHLYSTPESIEIQPYLLQAPIANAGDDQLVIANTDFTLDASASWDDHQVVRYEWYLNDILVSTQEIFTYSLAEVGNYTFELKAFDAAELEASDTVSVFVGPQLPVSIETFEGSLVDVGVIGDSVNGHYASYQWLLDGVPSNIGPRFSQRLGQGSHQLQVSVTDSRGNTGSAQSTIIVHAATDNTAPIAEAGDDIYIVAGAAAALNAAASQDDYGITGYEWWMGDNLIADTETFDWLVFENGVYQLELRVEDFQGLTSSDNLTVLVGPLLPSVLSVTANESLSLLSQGDTVAGQYHSYEWKIDGVTVSTQPQFTGIVPAQAQQISLTLTDQSGRSATATSSVFVAADTVACQAQVLDHDTRFEDTFPADNIPYLTYDLQQVTAIEALFNNARRQDQTVNRLLRMPSQTIWDGYSIGQQTLFLINSEREARGLRPFSGVSSHINDVAQAFAEHQLEYNFLGHHRVTDGASPAQRLDDVSYIYANRDAHISNENGYYVSHPTQTVEDIESYLIPAAVYGLIYHDKNPYIGNAWGHRSSILQTGLINNSGDSRDEGLIGVGLASGTYQVDANPPQQNGATLVINLIDPSSSWGSVYAETASTAAAHGCISSSVSFQNPQDKADIRYLQLSVGKSRLVVGEQTSLTVLGFSADGSSTDLSGEAILDDINNHVIAVSGQQIDAVNHGEATIVAELNGIRSNPISVKVVNRVTQNPAKTEFGLAYSEFIANNASKTLDERLLTVISGYVYDGSGYPIVDAVVSVVGAPEYGSVETDIEGRYTISAHAGPVTVSVSKANFIQSQRSLNAAGNQWNLADNIVLLPFSNKKTKIDFSLGHAQTHVSEMFTDERGSRAATLVFEGISQATVVDALGNSRYLSELLVSATEFTTPASMPASLPPESAFTYCAEFSAAGVNADESIQFDNDVVIYVDNFLDFEVGEVVPVGYYDRIIGRWVASDNGVVVSLLDINNDGLVDALDYNQDGVADDIDGDGRVDDETAGIENYVPGTTYWRTRTRHFTPYDLNWSANSNGQTPTSIEFDGDDADLEDTECSVVSSYIKPKSLEFHEDIPILGTGLTLHYSSRRTEGFRHLINVQVSDAEVPADALEMVARLEVAGHLFEQTFMPLPHQVANFVWDGYDIAGTRLQGSVKAKLSVGYRYPGEYYQFASAVTQPLASIASAWARLGSIPTGIESREPVTKWTTTRVDLFNVPQSDIGNGWAISSHHQQTPFDQVLRGDGASEFAPTSAKILKTGIRNSVVDGDDGYYQQKGLAHSFEINEFNEVVDKVTGLTWTYYDGVPHQVATHAEAITYCESYENEVTSAGDWRLPTEKEKAYGIEKSAANLGLLQYQIAASLLWSSQSLDTGFSQPVLCVRGTKLDELTQQSLQREADLDIVVDQRLQLAWQDTPDNDSVKMNWRDAINYCETLNHAGISQWRLPNVNELLYALPNTEFVYQTELDTGASAWTPDAPFRQPYWASTPNAGNMAQEAWAVESLGLSAATHSQLDESYNVRCVADYNKGAISPYVFDAQGRHVETLDTETGVTLEYFYYDSDGRLSAISDRFGNVLSVERDSQGKVARILSPDGYETELLVDQGNNLVEVRYANGGTYQFGYDNALMTWQSDPNGNEFNRAYDANGRVQSVSDPEGGHWEYYQASTDNMTSYGFLTAEDTVHETILSKNEDGSTRKETFFSDGSKLVRHYSDAYDKYEFEGGLVEEQTKQFDAQKQRYVTDQIKLTQISGNYEHIMQFSKQPVAGSSAEKLTISRYGANYSLIQDTANSTLTYETPLGRKVVTSYDPVTLQTLQVRSGNDHPVSYSYYGDGRLQSVTQAERSISYDYDAQTGDLIQVTNPLGEYVLFDHDLMGQVQQQTNYLDNDVLFTRDLNGNLIGLTPPERDMHQFGYDGNDKTTSLTAPDVEGWTSPTAVISLDKNRRISAVTRADGEQVKFFYRKKNSGRDSLLPVSAVRHTSQLDKITLADSSQYKFSYNTDNQLKRVVSPTGNTLNYSYQGSLLSKVKWVGETQGNVSYKYFTDFRLSKTCVNGKKCASVKYNEDNQATKVGALSLVYDDDLSGRLNRLKLQSTADTFTYNGFGQLDLHQIKYRQDNLLRVQSRYDLLGRVQEADVTLLDTPLTTDSYAYDGAGRLVTAVEQGTTTEYTYDANGNRLSRLREGQQEVGSYDAQDRILSYGNCHYTHAITGERTSQVCDGQTMNLNYDAMGNLNTVTFESESGNVIQTVEYGIDAQDRRIARYVDGVKTAGYLYLNQLAPIAELDADNNLVSRFYYGSRSNVPDYMEKDGVKYRFVSDRRGSPLLIVNASTGEIAQQLSYDEFGRILSDSNPGFQPFGFAGGLYDPLTGLTRFGARDYDAYTGRWTAKDPLGFAAGDTNLYVYAFNDPINFIDENGLEANAITNIVAGYASGWTWGVSDAIIGHLGLGEYVNTCSTAYSVGEAASAVTSPTGATKALFTMVGRAVTKGGSLLGKSSDAAFKAADSIADFVPKNKHLLGGGSQSKARFNTSDVGEVRGLVQEALRSPNAQFLPNPNIPGTFRVVTDLGRQVGVKGQTSLRTIVGQDGKVINSFPVNSR